AHDRHVEAADLLEDEDGEAPAPLVFEDERHDLVVGGDRLADVHDLRGEGAGVGGDEGTEILVHRYFYQRGTRSEVEVGAEADVFDLALEELAVGRVAE